MTSKQPTTPLRGWICPECHLDEDRYWELEEENKRLIVAIENAPCLSSGLGELTYECPIDNLCRVCEWRDSALYPVKEDDDALPKKEE